MDQTKIPNDCLRCTGCDGLTHHWICAPDENDPPRYDYRCKHCAAVGVSSTKDVLRKAGLYSVDADDEDQEGSP